MSRGDLRERMLRAEVPDAEGAEERSWEVVAAAFGERDAHPQARRRRGLQAGLVGLLAAGAAALALTPAGADVREWVSDVIDDDPTVEMQSLTRLPAGGEILVTSPRGVWLVADDGSRRLLGDYDEATFSPRGLYVAATRGRTLTAVDPGGEEQWSISRPGEVSAPRWAPSGYRVAFLEDDVVWVMPGDASAEPRRLDAAKETAPSWRPPPAGTDPRGEPNVLTYAQSRGVVTRDVDTGRVLWRAPALRRPQAIEWAGPDRLVVANENGIRVYDREGRLRGSPPLPAGVAVESVAASPDGTRVAALLRDRDSFDAPARLYLARIAGERRQRTVFSGFGRFGSPVFSPAGEWLLLPWDDTDQWLFINPSEDRKLLRRVVAIGNIARQFDPGGRGPARAPAVAGWCCP